MESIDDIGEHASSMETSFEDLLVEVEENVRRSADERPDVTAEKEGEGDKESEQSENSDIFKSHQRDILRAEAHIRRHLADVNGDKPPLTVQLTELRHDRPLTLAKAKAYAEEAANQGYTDVATATFPKRKRIKFPSPPPPPTGPPSRQRPALLSSTSKAATTYITEPHTHKPSVCEAANKQIIKLAREADERRRKDRAKRFNIGNGMPGSGSLRSSKKRKKPNTPKAKRNPSPSPPWRREWKRTQTATLTNPSRPNRPPLTSPRAQRWPTEAT